MPITFDGATKRIILGSTSVTAAEIWSRWVDWHVTNSQWPVAFRQVGGDALGGGLFISPYYFLLNGWRVRPMEANHTLIITGNLFVDGGGVPVVQTLDTFNVSVQYTVPVQAQGISTGGSGGATPEQLWQRVIEDGLTAEQVMRVLLAALAGTTTGVGTSAENYRSMDASKNRVVATFDAAGNRTGIALDGS